MKRVTFLARFHDGDKEMSGYEFAINGVAYVVHKGREPWEKHYFVSQKNAGLQLDGVKAKTHAQAIEQAKNILGAA